MLVLSLASLLLLPMGSLGQQPVAEVSSASRNGTEAAAGVMRAAAVTTKTSSSKTTLKSTTKTSSRSASRTPVKSVAAATTKRSSSSVIKPTSIKVPGVVDKAVTSKTTTKTSVKTSAKTTVKSTAKATPTAKALPLGKRGLAYNNASLTKPFGRKVNATSQVSWAYNWYLSPCESYPWVKECSYNGALQFVPMLYNSDPKLLSVWPAAVEEAMAKHGSKHLFTFNEPDGCFTGSSCMDFADAVATYKKHVQPFAGRIKLGAPAVTNAGAPHGLDWLSRFMAACKNCTFDFVNVHWYSNKYAGAAYFKSFIGEVRKVAKGRPIWVTEFALNSENAFTEAENQAFLKEVMAWMDAQKDVAAYAYFMDSKGLLIQSNGNGLSALGKVYDRAWAGSTVGALTQ